jgi:signal transduction histidine kinase
VLSSLIVNAIQAKARAVTVLIHRLASETFADGRREIPNREPLVEIVVRDDGEGIPDTFRSKIQRFGWTSKIHSGTGIGLTVSHLLAKDMGGELLLLSGGKCAGEPFTKFAIRIPTAQG